MENSKIQEHIINANNSRLKYISLISLGFSVFTLITDFFVHGVWSNESLDFYKALDIAFTIISILAVSFFWLFKIKNSMLQKTGILFFPFFWIIWSAVITGIDYGILGLSTLIAIILLTTFFLYLNLIVSIVYFVCSGLALMATIYFRGNVNENYLSLIFLLIPILGISVLISAKNYKNKLIDLSNQEKMVEMNLKLYDSNENLESEVEKRTKEILIALKKAEESDRLKTAFLHNISHEIRTPMNSIVGFSELLNDPDLLPEICQQYTNIIVKSSNHLLSIINDIISIATIDSGQEKIIEAEFHLNSTLQLIHEQFFLQAKKLDVDLNLLPSFSEGEDNIVSDETKLVQILSNLIGNALKFTKKGHINFGYNVVETTHALSLQFFVKDTGIGIPPEMQEDIFQRFRQVESATTRQFEGSGLGLSISKAYVELLGGKIWLNSELGKGSTFYFTIPVKRGEKNT
jgi:signal transduction histidine kinase